jgi:uncharacterized membrane protein
LIAPLPLFRNARPATTAALTALLLLLAAPVMAQRSLVIERFEAAIDVAVDGSIKVEETIRPRFSGSWNGIYRSIPIQYRTPQGLNYTLRLTVESITDENGAELRYESDRVRHYRKLKIFIPGATDTTKTVVIRYTVSNGLRFFDEHDELYWNVTGDEWEVPIEAASALVRLPQGVGNVRATSFRGAYGSTEQSDIQIDGSTVRVETTRGLGMREGLTIVVGWDPGVVQRPTAVERTTGLLASNLPLLIPPFVLFGMYRLWRARGRDPEVGPIAPRYEPPDGLTPAELGTLVDGNPDMRDITASIVDLAVRGFVHITEVENSGFFGLFNSKDYTFALTRGTSEWSGLKAHEQKLLTALFGGVAAAGETVTLSDLKNKFYKKLPGIKTELHNMLVHRRFYTARPDRVRALYVVGGLVAGAVVGFGGGVALDAFGMQPVSAIVAGAATGLIVAIFGWFMPARTAAGTREYEKVLGFQEFLSRVEGDRLERVVKTPEMFEKYLPYAMALGVEDNWSKAFDGIYKQPPQWYSGSAGIHTFRPSAFTSDLTRMSASAATVMAAAPRSSGGSGFSGGGSGGGFGGGGGGGF